MYRFVAEVWAGVHNFSTMSTKNYGIASRMGGSSTDSLYDRYTGKFENKDLLQFKDTIYKGSKLPGVNIITTPE